MAQWLEWRLMGLEVDSVFHPSDCCEQHTDIVNCYDIYRCRVGSTGVGPQEKKPGLAGIPPTQEVLPDCWCPGSLASTTLPPRGCILEKDSEVQKRDQKQSPRRERAAEAAGDGWPRGRLRRADVRPGPEECGGERGGKKVGTGKSWGRNPGCRKPRGGGSPLPRHSWPS